MLWIEGAPLIGKDDPEHVITWIQDKITCHIPNEKSNPELHRLVARYQYISAVTIVVEDEKFITTLITVCKFGFPRQTSVCAKVNPVEESLKSRNKI